MRKQCYICHKTYEIDEHFVPKVIKGGKVVYLCKVNLERYKDSNGRKPASKVNKGINRYSLGSDYVSEKSLLARYNISIEDYNELLNIQDSKCAICNRHISEFTSRFDIDHCHVTGKIKGLLCNNCNAGVGLLNDDVNLIKNAIIYLNKYK